MSDIFCRFCPFFGENTTDLVKKNPTLLVMSEEKNKKNIQTSVFFSRLAHFQLVGGIVDQRI